MQKEKTANTARLNADVNHSRCRPSRAGVKKWKTVSPAALRPKRSLSRHGIIVFAAA